MRSLITIQEGQFSVATVQALEEMLRSCYAKHIGPQKLTVFWNVAAEQHAISDRLWSRSSQISFEVPDGLATTTREAFLAECEEKWRGTTGQHPDQIALAAFDQTQYDELLKGNLERLSAYGRFSYIAKLLVRAFVSKMRLGVMIVHFNQ